MGSEYGPTEGIEQLNEGRANNQSIIIDTGKHAAGLAICAIVCGLCAAISWWAVSEQRAIAIRYHDDAVDVQDQYQKERNHVIELEARLGVLGDEVRNLKESDHVRRR